MVHEVDFTPVAAPQVPVRIPKGEKCSAVSSKRSSSKATNSSPCSQARQLSSLFFGNSLSPRIDFILLKHSSICHRQRYQARTVAASSTSTGTFVQTKKY